LTLHAFPRVLPGLVHEVLLQPVQPSLRCSYQILHGRVAVAHLGQHGFGRHTAIHHPDPARLAVLLLDLAKEPSRPWESVGLHYSRFRPISDTSPIVDQRLSSPKNRKIAILERDSANPG
jgi:hypothetical protein